jgi:hypothetical protein
MLSKLNTDWKKIGYLVFLFGISFILLTSCFTNPIDINWETTPLTGTILNSYVTRSSRFTGNSLATIDVKLDSGETVSIIDRGEMPVIVRGKKVFLNRGTTLKGEKFYRLASLQEK